MEKRFTLAEVRERDGRAGGPVWMLYKDAVYDVTRYLEEHPGGAESILEQGGRDGTRAFRDAGHSPDALTVLGSYRIGQLVEEDNMYDANGKKKKKEVDTEEGKSERSCLNVIFCGLIA